MKLQDQGGTSANDSDGDVKSDNLHPAQVGMSWWRLTAMVATSVVIMFLLMYQLVYEPDHLFFSLNRFIASVLMGCVMTSVMLAFMWSMYKGRAVKILVLISGIVAAGVLLFLNRSQSLVGDLSFMEGMIPHHSIAINSARKAKITDPRVRLLADQIISGQIREIEEMKILIKDIEEHGSRGRKTLPPRTAALTDEMLPRIKKAVQ